jgi:hypothetical protein
MTNRCMLDHPLRPLSLALILGLPRFSIVHGLLAGFGEDGSLGIEGV